MLGKASHREFDISLRTLPIEDREPFAVAVTSMLDGVLVDVLSVAQRFNRVKCSRVLDACTSDSSEEEARR